MKALVLNAVGRGFDFENVDFAPPIGREVLVDVRASGLCHTDRIRRNPMTGIMDKATIVTLTTHYIDGAFVESHGREVMDIIKPSNGQLIGRVLLGDEEDTRRAIAAAKRAFASFGRTTKDERSR